MLKTYEKVILGLIIFNFYLPIANAAEGNSSTNFISLLKSSFVSSLSIGPTWESAGQAQTLNLTPEITKTYTANKPTNTSPTGELFLGIRNSLPKQLEGQFGLAFVATGNATLSGNIWDDANPAFNNYTYQYKISHIAAALKGKLLGNWDLPIMPWISASLGVGFNKAYGFSNTPIIYEAVPSPNFTSNTTTAFTYTIGIGAERQLNPHWQIGAGYEFSDWGKSQLGSIAGRNSNQGLSLSHLYTNSILFNITYLA
jgi:opacity protein-like surface antigen